VATAFLPALLVFAGAMAVPVCLATAGFTMMSPYFSLAGEARAINREIASKPDAIVACEGVAPHRLEPPTITSMPASIG
jgi:hypothetical protein